jgi:glycosyltransferase involved in cell wall biosynthesis
MTDRWVALLGRRDHPTDGVADYCQYLSSALARQQIHLEIARVPWPEIGWEKAQRDLLENVRSSDAKWFLIQYTALSWSQRGFPLRVPGLIRALRKRGKKCAVVFHDLIPYAGTRPIDRFRRIIQRDSMRKAAKLANVAILPIPVEKIRWLPDGLPNAAIIPVGPNLPDPEKAWSPEFENKPPAAIPTVAVYSITPAFELERIAKTILFASEQLGPLRLLLLGRNSDIAGQQLQEKLAGTRAEVVVRGLLPAEEIVQQLASSDVLLFARGPISGQRGSALAAIACGLPVVAWQGWETSPPITAAGLALSPEGDDDQLAADLVRVLQDPFYRQSLRQKSRQAYNQHLSWEVIATQFINALK